MPTPVLFAIAIVASYLIGSIPFGLLIGKYAYGIDIRQHGSGNIGATNVTRILGRKLGFFCLFLDAVKGLLPTAFFPPALPFPDSLEPSAALACGAAAIAGHCFPVWLGFKGGKGVATGAGVAGVISPIAFLIAFVTFAIIAGIWRIVALASIISATAYALATLILTDRPFDTENLPLTVFALVIPALIIVRHRSNIVRLLKGREPAISERNPAEQTTQIP